MPAARRIARAAFFIPGRIPSGADSRLRMNERAHLGTRDRRTSGSAVSFPAPYDVEIADSAIYRASKRAFDLVVGSAILLLLLPVIPLIALMIRLDSPGPVFYRQRRVGQGGTEFDFYKFRSMYVDADRRLEELRERNETDGPVFKMRNDPRVTSVGRFLRRSSLDEIPQIFNVLRGDMSIVGPRPALPHEVAQYRPWHRRRLEVKPGITCLWQIAGRSHIGFEEWMRLDMEYLKTRSFLTDLRIFVQTIPAVIARRGAY